MNCHYLTLSYIFVNTLQCSHESQETRRTSLLIGVGLPPKISTTGPGTTYTGYGGILLISFHPYIDALSKNHEHVYMFCSCQTLSIFLAYLVFVYVREPFILTYTLLSNFVLLTFGREFRWHFFCTVRRCC